MKSMLRLLLILVLGLVIAGTFMYWWGLPEVVSVFPPDGARDVQAGSEIRLEFSRPMQADSVTGRLHIEPDIPGSYSWSGQTIIFQPAQSWEAGTAVTVRLDPGSRSAGSLSFHMRQGESWSFRVRQPVLAFLYPAGEPANIFTLDPLSGERLPLTDQVLGVIDFSVDATGKAIYFSAQKTQGATAIYRIELTAHVAPADLDGASPPTLPEPVLVWDCPLAFCRLPAASPRGDWLAFESTPLPGAAPADFPQVWLLPLAPDGGPVPEASPRLAGEVEHQTSLPSWSSAGLLAFYDRQTSGYVILDPHSGQSSLFANQTGQSGAWHPGGRYFAAPEINFLEAKISDDLLELANSHLILFDSLHKTTQDLSSEIAVEDASPTFSPDGTSLAFSRKYLDAGRWSPGRQVWMMHLSLNLDPVSSSQARALTAAAEYNHYELAWNPGGDQLAYVRFHQTNPIEPPEIWLLDPFSGRTVKLISGGYYPTWIP